MPSIAQAVGAQRVVLRQKPLGAALQEVARRFRVELLFSNDLVASLKAPSISGYFTVQEALNALLAGSGLRLRGSAAAGFVIISAPEPDEQAPLALPDILVLGSRTQNADIERRASDVQPYQVLSRQDVQSAHLATVEDLLSKRSSQNNMGLSYMRRPLSAEGAVRSSFDLRGLGMAQTLVLVDGRPMPRVPGREFALGQADVNALSIEAIERAEVITSTAGGIYGPGAIGGVVNLVLRRDYRGAEVTATTGLTGRGDGAYRRIDVRFGFTPDDGATDVMFAFSRTSGDGLQNGDRDFADRAQARRFANSQSYSWLQLPVSNSVNIASEDGRALTLKPAYGGQQLASNVTYLAPDDTRLPPALGTALLAHAGSLDFTLADGRGGKARSLVAGQRSSMVLVNARHRFGPGIEAYVDLIDLRDRGLVDSSQVTIYQLLSAEDSRNPFQQDIGLVRAAPGIGRSGGTMIHSWRMGGGFIFDLPGGWKSNLDYSLGSVRERTRFRGTTYGTNLLYALYGSPLPGYPALDFLASDADFNAAISAYAVPSSRRFDLINRMKDGAARFAGPLGDLGAGPVTATVLLEQRKERVAQGRDDDGVTLNGIPISWTVPGHSERVRSAYAELRAPILGDMTDIAPRRGLEFQLAVRRDATQVRLQPGYLRNETGASDGFDKAHHAALTYTAGMKAMLVPGLIARASIATGEQTPPVSELANAQVIRGNGPDPRRGNTAIEAPYELVMFENGKIRPERARALSAGLVFAPRYSEGPSLSLDYTHIRRSREVDGRSIGSVLYFLTNEAFYPDRVTRLPLTAEDAARGYTGGVITRIDTSFLDLGWTVIDAVDMQARWPVRTAACGDFIFRGNLTWQPRFDRRLRAEDPVASFVDYMDGALQWRGNGGVDWVKGPLSASLNGQFYGRYHVTSAMGEPSTEASNVAIQGGEWIGAQATFDLAVSYRLEMRRRGEGARAMDLRLGVLDIFDHRPATVVSAEGGYSQYADPLGRRFEISVAVGM